VKGKPAALADLMQFGLPQVGVGAFFEVWYLVPQIEHTSSTVLVALVGFIRLLLPSSSIHRWAVAGIVLGCLLFQGIVLTRHGSLEKA